MEVDAGIHRGDVYLVDLNPTRGSEIRKMKACVVVSPDELNAHLRTFGVPPGETRISFSRLSRRRILRPCEPRTFDHLSASAVSPPVRHGQSNSGLRSWPSQS